MLAWPSVGSALLIKRPLASPHSPSPSVCLSVYLYFSLATSLSLSSFIWLSVSLSPLGGSIFLSLKILIR